jgi:hypothetical protein
LASDDWSGQADRSSAASAQHGRPFTAIANADSLPPAEAVVEGRRAAFAIHAYLWSEP